MYQKLQKIFILTFFSCQFVLKIKKHFNFILTDEGTWRK